MTVQLLGIGACRIQLKDKSILIDAFNDYNEAPKVSDHDIILFTHSDGDHFQVKKIEDSIKRTNLIIGPPSITYDCLCTKKIHEDQLTICYPNEYQSPITKIINDITVTVFNTQHFLDWHNIHVSFLIEYNDKKIYFTGDSYIQDDNLEKLFGIDCLIYSLLEARTVKGIIDRKYGKYFNLCEIIEVKHKVSPKIFIGNHLIECNWATDPIELMKLINSESISDVYIPINKNDIINI